ncbi:hypothetical protein CL176_08000 [Suicoccus acidiformans]|uniref:DAGKc domain-containing protein n=1 Tax=Suicoccus acidiformans TaxID=2036206 RepID=A0A347WLI7_9LACT|nr:diacylglycerol kinase family protein [Suicoccus acidiformans]AXY25944.1 hypothetical protein CL176_08000 [Suicoccus acidiformans]
MFGRTLIIANPVAGKGEGQEYAQALRTVLEETYQNECTIKVTEGDDDAFEWSKQAIDEGFESVLCLGGDGTVSQTVAGLLQNKERPRFAFIPLGTVNDLARALGYSMNPQKAIERMKDVEIDTLDIGQINDQYFINVVAVGPIPESVMQTDSDDKNRLGAFAYVIDGFTAFFSEKGYDLHIVDADGVETDIVSNLLLIGLTNSIGGIEIMNPEAKYNDGLMYLAAIRGHNPMDTIRGVLEGGIFETDKERLLLMESSQFQITTQESQDVPTNVDGDPGPALPLDLQVLHQALEIYVPRNRRRILG